MYLEGRCSRDSRWLYSMQCCHSMLYSATKTAVCTQASNAAAVAVMPGACDLCQCCLVVPSNVARQQGAGGGLQYFQPAFHESKSSLALDSMAYDSITLQPSIHIMHQKRSVELCALLLHEVQKL